MAYEVFSEIYEEQVQILRSNESAIEKVKKVFSCYANITHKYGEIHPIIVDLLLTENGDEEFKQTWLTGLKNLHREVIRSGQEENIFKEGDPRLYEIFLLNMINPQIVKQISEIIPLEEATTFLADLALSGLLNRNE